MVWISLRAELVMVGLVIVSFWKARKRGEYDVKRKIGVFQMVGEQIVSIIPISIRKRDNTS